MNITEVVNHYKIQVPMILQFMDASKQYIHSKFELAQFDILYKMLVDVHTLGEYESHSQKYDDRDTISDVVLETERFLKIIQFELFVYCKN
jgi:hypothetical protein